MSQPVPQMTPWKRGESITAAKLNAAVDVLNGLSVGVAPPQQISRIPAGGGSAVQQFKFKSMGGDYIYAAPWDGTTEGAQIKVAKPYLLRRTPFDGKSRNGISYTYSADDAREATNGTDIEQQSIIPTYVVGDIVYAARAVIGGTEVEDVTYVDVNADARAWAANL